MKQSLQKKEEEKRKSQKNASSTQAFIVSLLENLKRPLSVARIKGSRPASEEIHLVRLPGLSLICRYGFSRKQGRVFHSQRASLRQATRRTRAQTASPLRPTRTDGASHPHWAQGCVSVFLSAYLNLIVLAALQTGTSANTQTGNMLVWCWTDTEKL